MHIKDLAQHSASVQCSLLLSVSFLGSVQVPAGLTASWEREAGIGQQPGGRAGQCGSSAKQPHYGICQGGRPLCPPGAALRREYGSMNGRAEDPARTAPPWTSPAPNRLSC